MAVTRAQVPSRADESARQPKYCCGYRMFGEAGKKSDLLGAKIGELIALAVAITGQSDGCIVVHTEVALKNGATEEEVLKR